MNESHLAIDRPPVRPVIESGRCGGEPGEVTRAGSDWLGWSDNVAHPNAPEGGGGPGNFSRIPQTESTPSDLPSPWQPGPHGTIPLQGTPTPRPPNPPPVTSPGSIATLKQVANDTVDVLVDAKIIADGSGGASGGKTTFKGGSAWSAPGYSTDKAGKILKFTGKFTWKGTIVIQTVYASGAKPTDVSCYGRGTTAADVRAGNITLGFHESCHRDDYTSYLQNNKLPDPPTLTVGMSEADYKRATKDFGDALKDYLKMMEDESNQKTDEVGHQRSTWLSSGKCYSHTVP